MLYQPAHVQTLSELTVEVRIFLSLNEMDFCSQGIVSISQRISLSSRWMSFPKSEWMWTPSPKALKLFLWSVIKAKAQERCSEVRRSQRSKGSQCGSTRQRRTGRRRHERLPCAAGPSASRSRRSQCIVCRAPRPKNPQYTLNHSQEKGQTDEWSHYRWWGTQPQSRGVAVLLNDSCGRVGEDGETKHPNHCQLLMGTIC